MADGAPLPSTVLTLSHWPGSPTPRALAADLSADIVFRYLASRRRWPEAEVATTDHFDQDGIVSLFALGNPPAALAWQARLVAVARAGDFQQGHDREAVRIAMVIAAWADPERAPSAAVASRGDRNPALSGALHEEVLGRLPDMLASPHRWRDLWAEEDDFLSASEAAIATGAVRIEESAAVDLAVVTVPPGAPWRPVTEFGGRVGAPCHPVAMHNATERMRVLLMGEGRYELRLRYETWVKLVSRRVAPRPDLGPLAARLTDLDGVRWAFDGAAAIAPRLAPEGGATSRLDPPTVRREVESFLAVARPAWDPWSDRPAWAAAAKPGAPP